MKLLFLLSMATLSLAPAIHADEIPQELAEANIPEDLAKLISAYGSTELEYKTFLAKKVERSKKFNSLELSKQKDYRSKLKEASELAGKKRITESLYLALEASIIFSDDPSLKSLIASNYINLRDFKHAKKFYAEAVELEPFNSLLHFNVAETDFVSGNYTESLKKFRQLQKIGEFNHKVKQFQDFVNFKVDLSNLGISLQKELPEELRKNHRESFDQSVNSRDTLKDHSLLTYYGYIAQAYAEKNLKKASKWSQQARYVFNKPAEHGIWLDSLSEFNEINNLFREATQTEDQ